MIGSADLTQGVSSSICVCVHFLLYPYSQNVIGWVLDASNPHHLDCARQISPNWEQTCVSFLPNLDWPTTSPLCIFFAPQQNGCVRNFSPQRSRLLWLRSVPQRGHTAMPDMPFSSPSCHGLPALLRAFDSSAEVPDCVMCTYTRDYLSPARLDESPGNTALGLIVSPLGLFHCTACSSRRTFCCAFPYQMSSKPFPYLISVSPALEHLCQGWYMIR